METLNFYQRLIRVQQELKAPKNMYNSFGKYNYRNLESILEAAKPILAKYDLFFFITDETIEVGGYLFKDSKATIVYYDEELNKEFSVEVRAQAGENPDKKGMDPSQASGSASSYARKYACNGLFLIDDVKDADATNTHGKETTSSAPVTKARLPKSGDAFNKVKSYLSKGGSLDEVKKKYQITKEVELLLNQ